MALESRDWNHPIVKAYDSIVEGKTIQVLFMTKGELNSFRTMLHQFKEKMDDTISSYDDDFKKKSLSFVRASKTAYLYNVCMIEPKPKSTFSFTILDSETGEVIPDE